MNRLPKFEDIIYYKIKSDKNLFTLYNLILREIDFGVKNSKDDIVILNNLFNNPKVRGLFALLLDLNDYIYDFEGNSLKIILNVEFYDNEDKYI